VVVALGRVDLEARVVPAGLVALRRLRVSRLLRDNANRRRLSGDCQRQVLVQRQVLRVRVALRQGAAVQAGPVAVVEEPVAVAEERELAVQVIPVVRAERVGVVERIRMLLQVWAAEAWRIRGR
jgi:hypothetical protein